MFGERVQKTEKRQSTTKIHRRIIQGSHQSLLGLHGSEPYFTGTASAVFHQFGITHGIKHDTHLFSRKIRHTRLFSFSFSFRILVASVSALGGNTPGPQRD